MQVVVFKLNGQDYALDIQVVKEILRMTEITSLPKTQDYIKGIINLRGNVTPIVSLYQKFGFPEKEVSEQSRIIILSMQNNTQIGIIVDSVTEVMNIDKDNIESADMELAVDEGFIEGIGKLDNRLLIILKSENLASQVAPV